MPLFSHKSLSKYMLLYVVRVHVAGVKVQYFLQVLLIFAGIVHISINSLLDLAIATHTSERKKLLLYK